MVSDFENFNHVTQLAEVYSLYFRVAEVQRNDSDIAEYSAVRRQLQCCGSCCDDPTELQAVLSDCTAARNR